MAYQHPQLGVALGWKYNHLAGITTRDGRLTTWPLMPFLADSDQESAVTEYQAYLVSATAKDDDLTAFLASAGGKVAKAIVLVGVDKGVWTLAEIKAKYRSL